MEHAWLDSLSEDWVSQPASENGSPAGLPPLKSSQNSRPLSRRLSVGSSSKIPRPSTAGRCSSRENSDNILSERSANDINIRVLGGRTPSKLSRELKRQPAAAEAAAAAGESFGTTDNLGSRLVSHSIGSEFTGSIVHNTVHIRSPQSSPQRGNGDTPEWKRRLVYGEVAYGEQRTLFCSAATGLENMFKPPAPPQNDGRSENEESLSFQPKERSFASSPPPWKKLVVPLRSVPYSDDDDDDDDDGEEEEEDPYAPVDYHPDQSPSPSPRMPRRMRYRANESCEDESLGNDSGGLQNQQPRPASSKGGGPDTRPSSLSVPPIDSRKTSGQSDIRNEDFSEITLQKHFAGDGKVDFTPAFKPDQLRDKLERLRLEQMAFDSETPQSSDFDPSQDYREYDPTEAYEQNGGFVNFRRGGTSADASFMNKPLSSGLATDTSEMLPEDSLQASTPKQIPSLRTHGQTLLSGPQSPCVPPPPHPSPQKPGGGSGSPLKLFGPYDTFTNQTLMRRISQFEDEASVSGHARSPPSPEEADDLSDFDETPAPRIPFRKTPYPARIRSVSHFGRGDLEGYEFTDMSRGSPAESGSTDTDKENVDPGPAKTPLFRFNVVNDDEDDDDNDGDSSPLDAEHLAVQRRRQFSGSSATQLDTPSGTLPRVRRGSEDPQRAGFLATPKRQDIGSSEGKRPRGSPARDPTPKRRRTFLTRSDHSRGVDEYLDPAQCFHPQVQAPVGGAAELPSHDDDDDDDDDDDAAAAASQTLDPLASPPSQPEIEPRHAEPADRPLRSPGRPKSSHGPDPKAGGNRKPSIKTQDFLDEAGKIMAMIRDQVRPSGLASLEESQAENYSPNNFPTFHEESSPDSTMEPFSRPPSREGRPLARGPRRIDDPELIDRLRQYQELSDMGDIITSSVRSMNLARDAIRAAREVERQLQSSRSSQCRPSMEGDSLESNKECSDSPGVRVTENPDESRGDDDDDDEDKVDYPSSLSGQSTSRTIHTGSSKGAENKKTIAPQSVSHLIPDEIGSMYLDRENNMWVKKPRLLSPKRGRNALAGEDSEDDPFASIPDLSVDMAMEMRNLRLASPARPRSAGGNGATAAASPSPAPSPRHPSPRGYVTLSPNAALTQRLLLQAREELNKLENMKTNNGRPGSGKTDDGNNNNDDDDDVEQEFSIHERRPTPSKKKGLNITFSSPIASIIQEDVVAEDIDNLEDDPDASMESLVGPCARDVRYQSFSKSLRPQILLKPHKSIFRAPSRQFSVAGQSFVTRPVSRIEEERDDEDISASRDSADENRQLSVVNDSGLVLREGDQPQQQQQQKKKKTRGSDALLKPPPRLPNTPGKRAAADPNASSILGENVGNFSLSPLSEFTVHQQEPSFGLEVSYVVGDKYLVTGDATKRVMSTTIRELVGKLSEVEPYEPYWGSIEEMDLRDKRLASLHSLDEFCGRLVTLDASQNALAHLDGVPHSVRQLKACGNMLSELTSWDRLTNLQYVDISNNDVKSLSGLKHLVHLRSLRVDNNNLTSLDGLDFHDGLLELRARDNHIAEVDFGLTTLGRLRELDLAGNRISSVRGLEKLPCLTVLRLQRNRLESLDAAVAHRHGALRHLDLTGNRIRVLDIAKLPALHLLHADRNCITRVVGFGKARQLDSLSLREQRGAPLDMSFLRGAYEVRKLFLSGNNLGAFDPQVDFLNLQLLEIANCGLRDLPAGLGQLMPNLRTLNVNFNAITDLSPIRFVPRLKKLLAAGNRLVDSAEVTSLLTEFPHLTRLDLRDNPVTQGFYPPLQVLVHADKPGGRSPPSAESSPAAAAAAASAAADSFVLPDVDLRRDELFAGRLDPATGMRRRLYRVVFVGSCRRLRTLDGLPVDRAVVLVRDEGFLSLVREGLLPGVEPEDGTAAEDKKICETKTTPDVLMDSVTHENPTKARHDESRWGAEDSFA